jgi:amino acid adenylation domain-containing protein
LIEWNNTATAYPREVCIHHAFEAQARCTPDAIALLFNETRVSYAELNRHANQLAHYLQGKGVGAEVLVGVCMERSVEMIVSVLAILKAGGVYVPLDPSYPLERLTLMMEGAGLRIVLAQQRLIQTLPSHTAEIVSIEMAGEMIAREPEKNPHSNVTADNLAYVMYTSGSTGKPKGVSVPHRAVLRLVKGNSYADFNADQTFLLLAPISFDASTFEIWGSLLNGARLVVMAPGTPSSKELGETLKKYKVSTLWLTAGLFHLMVDERLEDLLGLHQLLAGGDVLSVRHVENFVREAPGCRLIDGYGPTESTTFTCCYAVTAAALPLASVPIGKPIANTQVYILDSAMKPVRIGEPGELYIGGDGLARGYLNQPALSAELFVPNPFGPEAGTRLYKTGDLTRYLPDGNIEFLGRVDYQVKVRGYRIELGEIEVALSEHAGVRDVVVVTREETKGDKQIIAYVVFKPESGATVSEFRGFLKQRLPGYMIPSVFVILDALPLTLNGKVDRAALPAPEQTRSALETAYVEPRSPAEQLLTEIWSEVLGCEQVGVNDNFYELGGHSLKATQIVSRVRNALQVDLPLRIFFESLTIAELARTLESYHQEQQNLASSPALRPMSYDGPPPLSFSQERIWFLQQMVPTSKAYNFQATLRFKGRLDVGLLQESLNEITRRHEVLRTTFIEEAEGRPVQAIHPAYEVQLPIINLEEWHADEREAELQRLISKRIQEPFDLTQLPLIHWTLFRLNPLEHVMLHMEHHLLHDGWSFNVFLRELLELYEASVTGRPHALPPLPIQFADFAIWQREWMRGEAAAAQLEYWKNRLAGSPPVLELPLDHPRPALPSFRGVVPRVELPLKHCSAIRAFSREAGTSLYMTMLAAFLTLLYRYTEQEDISVGAGIANRRWRDTENLLGMLINNIVLRVDLSGDPTFLELLERVRRVTLEAYAHQDVPFEKVVEVVQPERALSHNPLFQAIFSFHDSPLPELKLPGLDLELVEGISNGSAKFDLNVIVIPRAEQHTGPGAEDEGITLLWEYSTDLFEEQTIARMLSHYRSLLLSLTASPHLPLSQVPMLSAAELHQLLSDFNPPVTPPPTSARHIVSLFEAQAADTPSALAVECAGQQVSYGELNARANRLGWRLRRAGLRLEERVGVVMERSVEMVEGMLGILKAGGAYVGLDVEYPAERLSFMLRDAGASLVLTHRRALQNVPALPGLKVICLDDERASLSEESERNLETPIYAENLAYVIYTSGSTGHPKGVAVSHHSLLNLVVWHQDKYQVTASDRASQVAGQSFDACVWELWPYLTTGASLHIIDDQIRADVPRLVAELTRQQITLSFLPTPLAEAALQEQWPDEPFLRAMLTGGDRLHHAPAVRLPFRLVNHYGPTENTVVATCTEVKYDDGLETAPPIGRPISNTQVYILDSHLQPVAVGVHGEMYLGGDGLARGYLNQPDLTAERFIPNPFSDRPGSRLYRTGDIGRYLPDGQIDFIGRADKQVKIRGFRIELGEIEAALSAQARIREAVVTVYQAAATGAQLVAYVVPEPDASLPADEMSASLGEILPEYMIPTTFVILDHLPLTPNGKVDHRALPEPGHALASAEEMFAEAGTPVQEIVAVIWAEVLKLERVGPHDNFFKLGGHSLLATQVTSRVRSIFNVELPLRSLFESPTVAAFAGRVESARHTSQGPQRPPLRPVSRESQLPLSFAQQRLWFLDQLMPESHTYNISYACRLEGSLDRAALEKSLNEIVRRHETLRTTFTTLEDQPVQVIAPSLTLELSPWKLSMIDASERNAEVLRMLSLEADRPFKLAEGPLLRAILLELGEQEHVLQITMHHIISDGWSMSLFIRELGALYGAYVRGNASPLTELPVQYVDYAVWQRGWLSGETLEAQLRYWRVQLTGAPPLLELPTDRPRPPVQSFRGANHNLTLDKPLTEALKTLARREGVTLYMLLLAAFKTLLYRCTGQTDINVGSPIAGRNQVEVEELIGFFVNTLVLRTDLDGNLSFRELLRRVREEVLEATAHQDLPFERLVEELQPARNLSHTPIFQVMFTLQNVPRRTLNLPGLVLKQLEITRDAARFDLVLSMTETEQGLTASLRYNTDLFDAATIERMGQHLKVLLQGVAADAERQLSDLPIMTPAEFEQVISAWNETTLDFPQDQCIHTLFESQVERTPGAVAVYSAVEQVTYRELDQRANQLAHYLQGLGVGPEVLVGLCMGRSVEMIVALLAVLKAGGAYVPLDPESPQQRLSFMLEDAGVRVLLSQERFKEELPPFGGQVIFLDRDRKRIARESVERPASSTDASNAAYVIYTSGSTGRPKGVVVQHRSASNLATGLRRAIYAHYEAPLRVGINAPLVFDSSFKQIIQLLSGHALIIIPEEVRCDSAVILQYLRENQVDVLDCTPSLLQLLVGEPEAILPRIVLVGGEAIDQNLWTTMGADLATDYYNVYGPTECTVDATLCRVRPELTQPNIGRPLANTEVYILDDGLQPVPIGVFGELCIGGEGLARGYLHRSDLTAEKFIPHPFSREAGQRLYRTGDVARYLDQGVIEFQGRADHQVKIRGFRVELGEIESELARHDSVQQCALMADGLGGVNQRLIAYAVGRGRNLPSAAELSSFLGQSLPQYMIPSMFIFLEQLPLLRSGKVNRRALPAPDKSMARLSRENMVPPVSPVEQTLARIWSAILELEDVGVHDNFFELGGHSLLATKIISQVRRYFAVQIPLQNLFRAPTISEFALEIEKLKSNQPNVQPPAILPLAREGLRLRRTTTGKGQELTSGPAD